MKNKIWMCVYTVVFMLIFCVNDARLTGACTSLSRSAGEGASSCSAYLDTADCCFHGTGATWCRTIHCENRWQAHVQSSWGCVGCLSGTCTEPGVGVYWNCKQSGIDWCNNECITANKQNCINSLTVTVDGNCTICTSQGCYLEAQAGTNCVNYPNWYQQCACSP